MIEILVAITGSVFLVELVLLVQAFRYASRTRSRRWAPFHPKVAVIAPHYGWEGGTEENVRRLLDLDYGGSYRVYFVTHRNERGADSSHDHLRRIAAGDSRARVLLARNVVDEGRQRSQKAENLLTALEAVDDDVEVFAFVDADAGIDRDWLARLVEPLQDREIGVSTGARFYAPLVPSIVSYTEAVWVNFQIPLYSVPRIGMVWGGSSAIRRDVFDEGGIRRRWERATFEDQHMTKAMTELGRRIHFVPDVLPSHFSGERRWKQVLEFTNRQMAVTYWMGLRVSWVLSLTLLLPKGLVFALTLPLVLFEPARFYPLLAVPLLESGSYLLFAMTLPERIRRDPRIRRTLVLSSLTVPFALLLGGVNGVCAVFKRSIVWGRVRYTNRGPDGCRVLGRVEPKPEREPRFGRVLRGARYPLARILGVVDPGLGLEDLSEGED
ncbi:MAG: glycosyltransferase family 2 protein [Candidatus Eisenbacteria bacterium]